jgi:hypothetical protein
MYIERDRHGIKIYPFSPADSEPRHLAAAGYLEVCAQNYEEFKGKVRFNITLDWLTAEKWEQLQAAMTKAFELSGKPRTDDPMYSAEGKE